MSFTVIWLITVIATWSPNDLAAAVAVHHLYAAREEAFIADDPQLLDKVYSADSPLREHDEAMMAAYRERGLAYESLAMRIRAAEVLDIEHELIRLYVVDRVNSASVRTAHGDIWQLPTDQWTGRLVELVVTDDGVRIRNVVADNSTGPDR